MDGLLSMGPTPSSFHTNGKTMSNILERSAKAHSILADILAILQDFPLWKYKVQVGLQLSDSMFVNGVY